MIELAMYASEALREKGKPLSKWEHFRNCIKGYLPDHVFAWHRWVDQFGEEWCERTGIAVWGAGGTTKSGIVGCFALFDLLAAPKTTLTVMVTNPQEKHWDRCFSKSLLWRSYLPEPFNKFGKLQQSPKPALLTTTAEQGSRRGILCISIDAGESGSDIAKKVGAHAPRTRLILEEGQGLPEATLDIGTNLFMGSTDKKGVVIGNPNAWKGNALGKASTPLSGDTKEIDDKKPPRWLSRWTWGDEPGVTLVFDGLDCPTNDSPEEAKRLSFMIQPRDIQNAMSIPGAENTLNFWSQIRGRIPPAGQCVTVLSDLDWTNIGVEKKQQFTGPVEDFVGCDLSLGGDKIPLYRIGVGQAGNYGKVAQVVERRYITIDITAPDRSGQIAVKFANIVADGWKIPLKNCALECSGQQGAIADRIESVVNARNLMAVPQRVYRVRSEEKVTERQLSNGRVLRSEGPGEDVRERAKDRYKDRATELVMNVVEIIVSYKLWGLDEEVRHQLTTRGIDEASVEGGAMKVQKKKEWRETHDDRSPDELDAVGVGIAMLFEKRIIIPGRDTRLKEVSQPNLPPFMLPPRAGEKSKFSGSYKPSASRISVAMHRRR